MRLREVVAESLYLNDAEGNPIITFGNQDSNVRDYYMRLAADQLPQLLSGYLTRNSSFAKLLRGCIVDFGNAHGGKLTQENVESLVKRIMSNLPNLLRQNHGHDRQ